MDYRRGGVWMRDAVLAVVLMSAVGAHIELVHASGERRVRTVTVNAVGSAQAEPDVARLVYTVEVEGKSVAAARERGSAVSAKILDAVKPENEKDIMTNRITTRPVHEWRGRRNYDRSSSRITVGYKYTNTVTITLRDLSMVADMTDRVLREGGDDVTLEKVHFELEDMEHVELAARTHAIAKARRYASTLAEGAAAKLGKVVSIQTQDGGGGPYFLKSEPMYVADMDMDVVEENSAGGFAGSRMTPISAGTRKVEIGVFVEFELNF
mmetsp:Transcript_7010/g.14934  ORF Transcript_7010/g.14934 Transcript_7010/m.14934 type:complete len:267 (-) Transcript_7010:150-950(-)